MIPDQEKPSFMDRGTLMAFAIILVFWFGWSRYMEAKYPQVVTPAPTPAAVAGVSASNAVAAAALAQGASGSMQAALDGHASSNTESFKDYSDSTWEFKISSKGMGLTSVHLKEYQTRTDGPVVFSDAKGDPAFATRLAPYDQPIDFSIEQTAADTFVGHAEVGGVKIEKTMKVHTATYSIETNTKVTGATKGVAIRIVDDLPDAEPPSFMNRSNEFLSWFALHDNGSKTRKVVTRKDGADVAVANVSVAALTAHYFALAVVDKSSLTPRFESKVAPNAAIVGGQLVYEPASPLDSIELNYTTFAGPKAFHLLSAVDENLTQVIDYGTFAVIGKPILWLLKFIQSIISNWGFAIIVLTIIVRLIVMPFNIYSYKSMKVMQKLQPEMNRIRERYADKPADQKLVMNQEIMTLMKTNKANPLGGCLPMLIQLPVFIALYQVLGQSIELYRAPFIFWIHDLSMKDPYFVLPVLMGITMFVQQRITPTTMDPAQAKILMWMPVIFSFFMISLPSGLTLYIFVSTLFGITQQFIFMRDRTPTHSVKEAKA